MAQGLGKNSPVVLSLGRENYEALIERHGQYVRWRRARMCPCTAKGTNYKDIHCTKCGGSGFLYGYQSTYTGTLRLQAVNGYLELPEENAHCTVQCIYNYAGVSFAFSQNGRFLELIDPPIPLTRGELLDIVFTDSLVSTMQQAELTRVTTGVYRVNGLQVKQSNLQGVYYTPFCDVVKIGILKDATDTDVPIISYRKDCVTVADTIDVPVLYAQNIEYIKPVKFIILSQNLNKATLELLHKNAGDAVCTFPYYYDVAEGDVITILSGTVIQKQALIKSNDAADDVLLEYFVDDIMSLESMETVYKKGVDFILTETNRIRWIGSNRPVKGTHLSVTFTYHPTYRVVKNVPSLRTSEDQRIPRKVIVQLLSNFQEKSGVHHN